MGVRTGAGLTQVAEAQPVVLTDALGVPYTAGGIDPASLAGLATDAKLDAIIVQETAIATAIADNTTPVPVFDGGYPSYEAVAASQTDQVMGATGAIGDVLAGFWLIPGTTSPGAVTVKDGATVILPYPAITLTDLTPKFIPLGYRATGAGWKITTGPNVSVVAFGRFT